ncbi:MAG: endonuclease/exonuclease/phosphatase family protein [Myxococcales bacterium]|nr:endonuclease/exonuclease/phosphatase family protein [Myxococcales bacterium]
MPRCPLPIVALALAACGGPAAAPDVDAARTDAAPTPPDAALPPDAPARAEVGVLSLNLHCLKNDGTAYATNAARFAAIAATIAAEQIDVLLAQELCVGAAGDARALLHAALASATGGAWASEVAATHRAWVGTPDEADEYVAVFTRGALAAPRGTVHRVQGSLRRVLLGATVTGVGATPLRVYTVHLDHEREDVRAAQGRDVASAALVEADVEALALDAGGGAVALPVVIAGDFNSTFTAAAPQALAGFGFVEASGSAATTRIDHVFAHRSAPLAATETRELFEGAAAVSDHPGVMVRFRRRRADAGTADPDRRARRVRAAADGARRSRAADVDERLAGVAAPGRGRARRRAGDQRAAPWRLRVQVPARRRRLGAGRQRRRRRPDRQTGVEDVTLTALLGAGRAGRDPALERGEELGARRRYRRAAEAGIPAPRHQRRVEVRVRRRGPCRRSARDP